MVPGIIKKLYHTTAVGLTDEDKQEVYPITATGAVYSPQGASSFANMRLDQILDALNQGYLYMGKATPTTNPGSYNHKVFYLASEAGTYPYFDNINVSGLTVLKTAGSGWYKDEFNITGGGGGGSQPGYIGTTLVQSTPQEQGLAGISQLDLTATARIYFGGGAYIEHNSNGFHFSDGLYSDGFVSAGGLPSGGGGGGGGSTVSISGLKTTGMSIGVLSIDGTPYTIKDGLTWGTYDSTNKTVQLAIDGVTRTLCVDGYSSGGGGGTTVSWGTETSDTIQLTVAGTTKTLLTALPNLYIGTTSVQTSSQAQGLTGISSVKLSSNDSLFEWDTTNSAWHFHGNLYADGWVSAGGVGSGGGGSYTAGTGISISNDVISLLPASSQTIGGVKQGNGIYIDGSGTISLALPKASASTLGGIKVGSGLSIDSNGVLSATGGGGGSGTVTSVGMTVPTGLSVSGSPITSSGTLAVSLSSGYEIPLSADVQKGVTAYGWFEVVNLGTTLNPNYALHVKNNYALYSDSWVSAGGAGSGGSSGGSSVSWGTESGYTVPLTVEGVSKTLLLDGALTGYATQQWVGQQGYITSSSLSGYATQSWVQSQGYLTSHQTIYALTLSAGSFTAGTYTPNSAAKTINVPTTLDHISDGTSRKLADYLPKAGGTMTGDLIMSGANIRPSANNTCSLGTSSYRWSNIYGDYANLSGDLSVTGDTSITGDLSVNGDTSLSGDLSMLSNKVIHLGPVTISYDSTNHALHISGTYTENSQTKNLGLYCDGYVSAGGHA